MLTARQAARLARRRHADGARGLLARRALKAFPDRGEIAGRADSGTLWRVHAVEPRSRANGPGARFVIWSQGCTLGCPGCFNPHTHPARLPRDGAAGVPAAGTAGGWMAGQWPAAQLAAAAAAQAGHVEGVTLTGGEPLQQPAAVAAFCAEIRARTSLGIVVLTGYARAEIEADPGRAAAVADADMVIAGRYNSRLRTGAGLRGSANKQYWARTCRYTAADFDAVPDLEIAVAADGTVTVSGMPDGPVAIGAQPGQPASGRERR
jgi:anaerobic ribonucleoside-triphosphate reductase activating protein